MTEFVRALALAWKNLAAYPSGHPLLVQSLNLVNARLAELRGPAGEVALGISNDGLLYGDLKIDSLGAQKFAQALYTRGVAVIRLANETTTADIETFLRLLAAGTPADQKRPIWSDLTAAGVMNINLQPVDYSAVQLTNTLDELKRVEPHERSLWDEILRALLEGRQFSSDLRDFPTAVQSADELAQMIAQYTAAAAPKTEFDPDATFGIRVAVRSQDAFCAYLADTVGRYIAGATGLKRQNSLQQAIQLLRSLPDPVRGAILNAVIRVLAEDETAGAALRDFTAELPSDEVLEALRYLSSIGRLSQHAMLLLQSLMAVETHTRAEAPSENVINDLVQIFGEEDVDRFNPADHRELLASVAIHIPQISPDVFEGLARHGGGDPDPIARPALMQQILLDLLSDAGPRQPSKAVLARLGSVVRSHLGSGDFRHAADLIQRLQEMARQTSEDSLRSGIEDLMQQLSTGETIQKLVEALQNADPEKAPAIQRLIGALGSGARRSLMLALAEENNRSRRRRLFDLIASLGPVIAPDAIANLADSRWYVVRNMITLLRAVKDRTSVPELRKLAVHADLRVRLEAIKSLFAFDPEFAASLLGDLINDPDPKVADIAISLVGSYGIKEGVGPLLRVLDGKDILGARRALRVKAIRALGELGDPSALNGLERFFTSSMFPWPSKVERQVAWETLRSYPPDARQPFVEKGLRARDAQVRAICESLVRS